MIQNATKIKKVQAFQVLFTCIFLLNTFIVKSSINESTGSQLNNQPPSEDYYQDNFLKYGDFVYNNNIKTILFYKKGFELSPPLIRYNSNESLILKFDDLDGDYKNYFYTIIHCNSDWQPSQLRNSEYIDGFFDDQITDYQFSINTLIDYTHYTLEFPNKNIRPKVSGNFILKVYLNNDPDQIVLTRKFQVFEQLISIEGSVKKATLVSKRDEMQEINFTINSTGYRISNPYQDLKVTIKQNGRTDNIIWDLKPKLVLGDKLVYEYEEKNLFDGGNEFRRFDIRSLRFTTERVSDISATHSHYEVFLFKDQRRSSRRYTTDDDINGRFYIKTTDAQDSGIEADYAWVHFSLKYQIPEQNGNFYIVGSLTDWSYTAENRMKYSFRDNEYYLSMLLKQGYYNYMYVFLQDGKTQGETYLSEGNHSDAENDYTIYVYHRKPGNVYDSLIGILHLNSGIRQNR
ncbi:MAG: DUF5103 domain-containing protein [Bacteroidetes bacterium]|nr:DUF5103 domain-containing protein [Bacteroidota bacterium]